jgi:hypothetical protein
MRSARFGLLFSIVILNAPVWAQQTPTLTSSSPDQTATTPSPVTKDPQAVSVVTQALAVAGGVSNFSSIEDYTASGNVTYHQRANIQGTVTVRESGLVQLRVDANLSTGVRSESISDGQVTVKTENGPVGEVLSPAPIYPGRVVLPHLLLSAASIGPDFTLSYRGTVQIDGRSAHDIQVQRVLPGLADPNGRLTEHLTMDFFIDGSTFQVLMMQDFLDQHAIRQIRYSDYRPVSGVQLPFGLSEQIEGHQTWTFQLSRITFNTGLQDSDFKL